MTIAGLIDMVDNLKPNQIEHGIKEEWLKNIEGQLWDEIILTHEDVPETVFDVKTATGGTELTAQPPYSDLYRFYLEAQIDLANGEMTRYNNSMMLFNGSWMAYRNYYNRRHMPITRVASLGFMGKGGCEYGPLA